MALIGQLDALRVSGEIIQLVENWGAVECLGGDDVPKTIYQYEVLDRDQSLRLMYLLDQCVAWNSPDAIVIESEVIIDGSHCKGEGISWGSLPGDSAELDCGRHDATPLRSRCP